MKRIFLKREKPDYPEDVWRIVRIFADRGYGISEHDAEDAWLQYSDSYAAGWLIMDGLSDDQIFESLRQAFTEDERAQSTVMIPIPNPPPNCWEFFGFSGPVDGEILYDSYTKKLDSITPAGETNARYSHWVWLQYQECLKELTP